MSLVCSGVTKRFGEFVAVDNFDCTIDEGGIVGLMGPNGSGKTTLVNVVSGIYKPDGGRVLFRNEDITGKKPHFLASKGLVRTFQIPRPPMARTVIENVAVGAIFAGRAKSMQDAFLKAGEMCDAYGLRAKAHAPAKNLTTYERKMLEFARIMVASPKLVMLDEVMAGLSSEEIAHTLTLIRAARDKHGITFLVIEHILKALANLCDSLIVISSGKKICEGPPSTVFKEAMVIQAYLGRASLGNA